VSCKDVGFIKWLNIVLGECFMNKLMNLGVHKSREFRDQMNNYELLNDEPVPRSKLTHMNILVCTDADWIVAFILHSYHQMNRDWCAAVYKLLQTIAKAGTNQIVHWENNISYVCENPSHNSINAIQAVSIHVYQFYILHNLLLLIALVSCMNGAHGGTVGWGNAPQAIGVVIHWLNPFGCTMALGSTQPLI
jgi:hypothetical protein